MAYTIETLKAIKLVTTDNDGTPVANLPGVAGDLIQDNFLELSRRTEGRRFVVTSYGALGDGSTDDQAAIQAAIDACTAAGGGEVYLPAGTYAIEDSLVPHSNVTIVGDGMDLTIIAPSWVANKSAFHYDSGTYNSGNPHVAMHFRDFTIDGSGASNSSYTTNCKGFYALYMQDCSFTRVCVRDSFATGFGVDFLVRVSFDQCLAIGCGSGLTNPDTQFGGNGFGIGTGGYANEEVSFTGCHAYGGNNNGFLFEAQATAFQGRYFTMTGCTSRENYRNLRLSGMECFTATGCHFHNADDDNIYITGSVFKNIVNPSKIVINGCVVKDAGDNGITIGTADMDTGVAVQDITISNCEINGNTDHGIQIDGGRRILIVGNQIGGNGSGTENGILLNPVRDINHVHIVGNDIYNNQGYGIRLGAGGAGSLDINYCVIENNKFYDDQGSPLQDGPILLNENTSVDLLGCVIRNNHAIGHTSANNDIDNAANFAATEVKIYGNTGHNPVGPSSITVGSSPFTYTAGPSPETVHIRTGNVSAVVKGGVTLHSTTGCSVNLSPGESITVTYSIQPIMNKDVH